jgi:hypothetical protein
MGKEYFYLGTSDDNSLVKFFRILFGIMCVIIAVFWIFYIIKSLKSELTIWITIFFLLGFGFFQIWTGLGYAKTFIMIDSDSILLKKNPVLPKRNIKSAEIEHIELFPLNLIVFLKAGKKVILRFGTTYPQMIDDVKDAVILFAEKNTIPLEINEEEF